MAAAPFAPHRRPTDSRLGMGLAPSHSLIATYVHKTHFQLALTCRCLTRGHNPPRDRGQQISPRRCIHNNSRYPNIFARLVNPFAILHFVSIIRYDQHGVLYSVLEVRANHLTPVRLEEARERTAIVVGNACSGNRDKQSLFGHHCANYYQTRPRLHHSSCSPGCMKAYDTPAPLSSCTAFSPLSCRIFDLERFSN